MTVRKPITRKARRARPRKAVPQKRSREKAGPRPPASLTKLTPPRLTDELSYAHLLTPDHRFMLNRKSQTAELVRYYKQYPVSPTVNPGIDLARKVMVHLLTQPNPPWDEIARLEACLTPAKDDAVKSVEIIENLRRAGYSRERTAWFVEEIKRRRRHPGRPRLPQNELLKALDLQMCGHTWQEVADVSCGPITGCRKSDHDSSCQETVFQRVSELRKFLKTCLRNQPTT